MKLLAAMFQMLGIVITHWTWCSFICGSWRARPARAWHLTNFIVSVTTKSAGTFLPIASSICRSCVIFENKLKKKNFLVGNCKCCLFRSNDGLIVWLWRSFIALKKLILKPGSDLQARIGFFHWFQCLCVKNHRYLWAFLAPVRILST